MDIKEIRKSTGLTQREFAERYLIPLQTIKQWESDVNSKSYRKPPEYVVSMLSVIAGDYRIERVRPRKTNHLIRAAIDSRTDANLWYRYLRKEFSNGEISTSKKIIKEALSSDKLTYFQKISLKQALDSTSVTAQYINSLNQKAETIMLERIMRRRANV